MKNHPEIQFLIFDLGNVIYDIDYQRTFNKLYAQLPEEKHPLVRDFMVSPVHFDLETGKIDAPTFRDGVRDYFSVDWEDNWIDEAWNSLLVDIPQERLDLLLKLKEKYPLYMLSNTNSIHFKIVEQIFAQKLPEAAWPTLFDHLFLSHKMGLRKPGEDIYRQVVNTIGAKPETCLFFDDLKENLLGAEKVGIKTCHIDHPKALINFFGNV
ncbi:putative hydrolase of the HAD superfamily [Cyclobacterium lianum]|uniref:Putative hydrolase of the HAD superfamily n=1 Tax=Cyclobacterium lianum TaxID=388280 RepID=A0A1M7QTB6_9BACT|nr:HAD-IA family hydrolase [Cyclobacterium lianum]SHN34964.1 putative hydrolase of the HAD superfamily [Cyclobacterium lianum]